MSKTIILILTLINLFNSQDAFDKNFDFKVSSIHVRLKSGSLNCTQVANYFLQRYYAYNPKLKALITINANMLAEARALDNYFRMNNKELKGKLHCIPVTIKDNIDVAQLVTSAGLKALQNSTVKNDAHVV